MRCPTSQGVLKTLEISGWEGKGTLVVEYCGGSPRKDDIKEFAVVSLYLKESQQSTCGSGLAASPVPPPTPAPTLGPQTNKDIQYVPGFETIFTDSLNNCGAICAETNLGVPCVSFAFNEKDFMCHLSTHDTPAPGDAEGYTWAPLYSEDQYKKQPLGSLKDMWGCDDLGQVSEGAESLQACASQCKPKGCKSFSFEQGWTCDLCSDNEFPSYSAQGMMWYNAENMPPAAEATVEELLEEAEELLEAAEKVIGGEGSGL